MNNLKKCRIFLLFFCIMVGSLLLIKTDSQAAPAKPRLNVSKLNMTKSGKFTMRVYNAKKKHNVSFSSSDKNVVDVYYQKSKLRKAKIKAINVGTATITVTIKNKRRVVTRLRCEVKVGPQAVSIKFLKSDVMLSPGESLNLRPILKPNTSVEIPDYSSSNPEVASVNSRGKVIALTPGITEITATLLTGQTARYIVHVGNFTTASPPPTLYQDQNTEIIPMNS